MVPGADDPLLIISATLSRPEAIASS